jgi:polyisoprenoid-binding protein YceI
LVFEILNSGYRRWARTGGSPGTQEEEMSSYYDSLRAMYRGGRANASARRLSRMWATVFGLGLAPRRWVMLEVPGRRTGRITRFPLGMADLEGQWYLVPMLGERSNWVLNVRAAGGRATLRHGRAVPCRLAEVPVSERAPIIKRYLQQVPGGRPHIPVDRRAPVADFEAVAPRYPVFRVAPLEGPGRPPRKRHWWRWIIASALALVLLLVLAAGLFVKLQPSPAPLRLPRGAARPPTGPVTGTWRVGAGSVAGFRVQESALGFTSDVVGRTRGVTGTIVVSDGQVTATTLRVNLAAITVNGKAQPQFAKSLDTASHPVATFTLARPVPLGPAFASGATVTLTGTGDLTLRGATRPATFTISARRDGPELQAAGSIPVAFSAWGIKGPAGFAFLGSLAGHGVAEFFIAAHRGGAERTSGPADRAFRR